MKKSIFLLLILTFILTACNKTEPVITEEILPTPIEEEMVNSDPNVVQELNSVPVIENTNIKEIKIYSPVYTLTGETLSGTTKVEIVFSGSTKKDAYLLKQFKVGDTIFTTNLRLDYGNIEKGDNNYEIKFYNKKDEIIGSGKYLINAEFEEVKIQNKIIYISKERDKVYNTKNKNFTFYGCLNQNVSAIGDEKILIKSGNSFYVYVGCLTFSEENNYLFTFKESNNYKTTLSTYPLYDVYLNDNKVINNYVLFKLGQDLGVNHDIVYDKKTNIIYYSYGSLFVSTIKLDLNTGKDYGYYTFMNIGENRYENSEKTEKESFTGWENFYNTNEIGNIKNDNKIVTFIDRDGTQEKNNYFSVFRIEKDIDGIKYGKNFIYNNSVNLKINQEQFYYNKDDYEIGLGDKNFKLDYKDLVNNGYKMSNLLDFDKNNLYNKFYGKIYLEKLNNNEYILNIGNQKTTKVNKIGITACLKEEYIIPDNQQIEENFKYNISEKLNNKCDIPYKINVYYEDGNKETGEYYVLFDY